HYCDLLYLHSFPTRRSSDLVEPFVMRHRWIVSISTNGKQKKNTECRQYAIERFHGSLRYGLSPILASANHTNFPAINQATFCRKDRKSTRLNSSHVKISYAV